MSAGLTEGNSTDFTTGTGAALNAIVVASQDVNNYQAAYLQITGTFSATSRVQGSNDGTNFVDVLVTDISNASASPTLTITAPGIFYVPTAFRFFQLKITAYTSGTVSANVFFQLDISGDLGPRTVNSIQSGTWTVQSAQSGVWSVGRTWTLSNATDSVAAVQSGTWTVVANEDKNYGTVGANTLRTASQVGNATGAADFNAGATGAQTLRTHANQGAPGTAANAWFEKITDGTNVAAVKAASTAAAAADPSLVVALSPNSPLPAGANNIGSVNAIQSGTWNVNSAFVDVAPATQTIIALDTGVSSLVGANGQVFYFGTPTTNSAATFALSSIDTIVLEASLLGAGGTMVVEVSMDGGTFYLRPNVHQISTQNYTNGFTAPFIALVNVAGMTHLRVRSTVSWTGTATITVKESLNVRGVTILDSLPAGANVIGGVTQSGTWTVTAAEDKNYGTVGATTLRVASQIGNATGAADFNAGATGAQTLRTQANQGAPGTAANAWFEKITDGTNVAAVKAASTAAAAADPSLVVALSPNSPLPAGTAILGALVANQSINLAQIVGSAAVTAGVAGLLAVGGNVASGATDAGNPVKVGGVFQSTPPTLTNGQRGDLQLDARARQITVEALNLGTGVQGPITVTTTATEIRVGASRLANRSTVTAHNNGAQTLFWGYTNAVTITTGTPLAQGQVGSWKVGDGQSVYLIATSGSQNVRVTEA